MKNFIYKGNILYQKGEFIFINFEETGRKMKESLEFIYKKEYKTFQFINFLH